MAVSYVLISLVNAQNRRYFLIGRIALNKVTTVVKNVLLGYWADRKCVINIYIYFNHINEPPL